ncbi:hypothetical protein ACLOJK_036434, partial [Asimina triloba]
PTLTRPGQGRRRPSGKEECRPGQGSKEADLGSQVGQHRSSVSKRTDGRLGQGADLGRATSILAGKTTPVGEGRMQTDGNGEERQRRHDDGVMDADRRKWRRATDRTRFRRCSDGWARRPEAMGRWLAGKTVTGGGGGGRAGKTIAGEKRVGGEGGG